MNGRFFSRAVGVRARRARGALAVLVSLACLVPGASLAQEANDGEALMREVFVYPEDGRRDPFEPLSTGDELGPRFEDLRLAGVIYSPEGGSVAVLADAATRRRYRVWEGDEIGGARLVAVRTDEAEFQVTVFGVSRRDTLRLRTQDKEQDR